MSNKPQSRSVPWDKIGMVFIIILIVIAGGYFYGYENILPGPSTEDDSESNSGYRESIISLIGRWRYPSPDGDIFLVLYADYPLVGQWSTEEVMVETFVWSCADNMITLDYPSDRDSDVLIIQSVSKDELVIITPSKLFFELFEFIPNENVLVFQRAIS